MHIRFTKSTYFQHIYSPLCTAGRALALECSTVLPIANNVKVSVEDMGLFKCQVPLLEPSNSQDGASRSGAPTPERTVPSISRKLRSTRPDCNSCSIWASDWLLSEGATIVWLGSAGIRILLS